MKTIFTSAIALFCFFGSTNAQLIQTCFSENFSTQTTGWTYSQGASEGTYNSPVGCRADRGIITPGVGGNNPANVMTPSFISDGALTLQLGFDIYRVNSNLNCATWSDFGCPTSIDVFYYVGTTKYTGVTDLVLPANGPGNSSSVSFNFSVGNHLPAGTVYRVELAFKPKSGIGNCGQPGTKYILDNFKKCEINCINCIVDAQNDNLCDQATSSNTVAGDLSTNDLKYQGANVTYSLANGPFANGASTIGGATLVVNANGTFTLTRTDLTKSMFDFTYRVTDNLLNYSDLASVTICFPVGSVLPVVMTEFTALRKDDNAMLTWKTASESYAMKFDVERMINNKFTPVGSVVATNSSTGSSYTFMDKNTATASTQYRLKMIDKDSKFTYSEIRIVKGLGSAFDFTVFPNPSVGATTVTVSDVTEKETIQLVDYAGRIVRTMNGSTGKMNIQGLQKGLYFMRVTNPVSGEVVTKKLIIN